MKKAFKIVGYSVLALFGLIFGGAAAIYFTVDFNKLLNDQIAKFRPEIEKTLGPNRRVEIGPARATLLPKLGARIADIKISGNTANPYDNQPLINVGAAGFSVNLWDAIISGGKRITISTIYVDKTHVRLLRFKDGQLSIQDILDHMAKEKPEEEKGHIPPDVLEYIRNTKIGEIRLGDASIQLVDFATATGDIAESNVRKLNVSVRDVRLSDPIKLHVDAAIQSQEKNFDFDITAGPLPQDLVFKDKELPRLSALKIDMRSVDISPFAPYLGSAIPAKIDSARMSAHYELAEINLEKPIPINGFFALDDMQIAGGRKFNFRVDSKMAYDIKNVSANIDSLSVVLGSIRTDVSGQFSQLKTAPKFKALKVHTNTLDVSKLLSYYPPLRQKMPEGFKMDGPITIELVADGDVNRQTGRLEVDATPVDVLYPELFVKPKGTTLSLRAMGMLSASGASLNNANFKLDELSLDANGEVKNFLNPYVDFTLKTNQFSFDRLARLIPTLRTSLEAHNAKATGAGELSAKVVGSKQDIDAKLDFGLRGVNLSVPNTELKGNVELKASAKGNPNSNLKVLADFDATPAVIKLKDTLHKESGVPMLLGLDADKTGNALTVNKFALRLAELNLGAQGTFNTATSSTDMKVNFDRLDLEKFANTVTAIPKQYVKGSYIDMKLGVKGNPNDKKTLQLAINDLNAKIGKSDLKGNMSVRDLDAPEVGMKLSSGVLDVDELMAIVGEQPEKKEEQRKDNPELKKYRFDGRLDAGLLRVKQNELRDLRMDLTLRDGLLSVKEATFELYDGKFNATGSKAEIWKAKMPFDVNFSAKGMDINKALSAKSKYVNVLLGKTDLAMAAKGEGFELPDLEQNLAGRLDFAMKEGRYKGTDALEKVTAQLSVLRKVPGLQALAVPKTEGAIKDLEASFKIADGKLNLRKPMKLNVGGAKMTLDGAIGIGGGLFLEGTYLLNRELVTSMTNGKCKAEDDFPVPIKVGGTFGKPSFEPDAKKVGEALLAQCLKGQAGKVLEKVIGKEVDIDKAKEDLQRKADEEKARIQKQADDAKREAEARAAEEKRKAEERVNEEKRKAEERAKQEAEKQKQKGVKSLKKKLGF